MDLFPVILAANFVTLIVVIVAAIKFASWSYRLIALVALAAFLFALYQFQSGIYQPGALMIATVLDVLIALRIVLNWRRFKRR